MIKNKLGILASSLSYAATLLLILSACSEDIVMQGRTPILLEARNIPAQTRAASNLQNDAFLEGAKISAYITSTSTNTPTISDPTTYTASAPSGGKNTLTPDVMPYYPNEDVTIDIHALYPQDVKAKLEENNGKFSVAANQTEDNTYMACDLMYASVSNHPRSDQAIALQFHHKMAKVTVNATLEEPLTISSVTLNGVKLTAPFNAVTGIIGTAETLEGEGTSITLATTESTSLRTLSGSVLFPPQTITNADFIQVETNLGPAKFAITNKEFQEGKEYTIELNINLENLSTTAAITGWDAARGVYTVTKVVKKGVVLKPITESFTYDGTAQTPSSVEVVDGQTEISLTEGVDYSMVYFNNIEAGSALAVAMGQGASYGTSSSVQSYIIQQADAENMGFAESTITKEYEFATRFRNELNKDGGDGDITFTSSQPTVATIETTGLVSVVKNGTTVIRASMADNKNYKAKTVEYTLNITRRKIAKDDGGLRDDGKITFQVGSYNSEYDGTSKKPKITVTDTDANGDSFTLAEGLSGDYTVSYEDCIDVGTATAIVTGVGKYEGTRRVTYTISTAQTMIMSWPTEATKTLGIGETFNLEATSNYGTIRYVISVLTGSNPIEISSTGVVTAKAEGSATVTAYVDAGDNYTAATPKSITINVAVQERRFDYDAGTTYYTYTCPATATYTIEVVGAAGGNYNNGKGGAAGIVRASCKLNEGDVLYVYVGGAGQIGTGSTAAGGYNGGGNSASGGGGGGGGASDIRIGGTALTDRKLVGAGGGGASSRTQSGQGGGTRNGGNGGSLGVGLTGGISGWAGGNVGGGGGGGYYGGKGGSAWGGGYGGSNYVDSSWNNLLNGSSSNGPQNGNDTNTYNGYVIITYKY